MCNLSEVTFTNDAALLVRIDDEINALRQAMINKTINALINITFVRLTRQSLYTLE